MGGIYSKVVHAAAGDLENVYNRRDVPAGLSTPDCRLVTNRLLDPRSVTLGIKRTPLMFNKDKEDQNKEGILVEKKLLETDIDTFVDPSTPTGPPRHSLMSPVLTPSPIIADLNETMLEEPDNSEPESADQSALNEIEKSDVVVEEENSVVEETVSNVDDVDVKVFDDVLVIKDSPQKEDVIVLKNKLMSTPECRTPDNTPTKPLVRTPLALVSQNATNGKLWRGIQEERKYRGLKDSENTPPAFKGPLPEVNQSAPPQIHHRHRKGGAGRHAIVWDENTLVI